MNANTLYFLLCGFLGVIFYHLLKYNGLSTDAKKLNVTLTFKQYIQTDWVAIMLSFLSVVIWLLCFGEVAEKYPLLQTYARVSFVCMGAIGTYVISLVFSKAKVYIRNVMDKKSDIADNKTDAAT